MSKSNGVPDGVTGWSLCPHCHFENFGKSDWRWRCDAEHPEIVAQVEAWEEEQRRQREEAEEKFWNERD